MRLLDRLFDLGPAPDPRRVAVGKTVAGTRHTLSPSPGAALTLGPAEDADSQLALLWAVRNGVPWVRGHQLSWQGRAVTLEELRSKGRER